MHLLSQDQTEHLQAILRTFTDQTTAKYVKGQQEHGGDLWKKKNLMGMLIEELLDGFTYAQTLSDQKGKCSHCGGEITLDDFGEISED